MYIAASGLATLLFGVAVGNSMLGLPIDASLEFQGGLMDLLQPYALLVGTLTVTMFLMHGSIYLYLKTEGELQARIHGWMWRTFGAFLVTYMATTVVTLVTIPHAARNFGEYPLAWVLVGLNILAIANIPRAIYLGRPMYAFLSSCATIAALIFLFGMALFPNLIYSSLNPGWSLDVYNAASSQKTLSIMRTIAFIGMPFVLTYTVIIYWTFRGKVNLGKFSY